MNVETLQLFQTVAITVALLFTLYQFHRFRREAELQRQLEVDRRYVEFVKHAISSESADPPVGYDRSLLQHFISHGGTKKDVLLYDLLFSTWEAAFLLREKQSEQQWDGWKRWMQMFFIHYPQCHLAWDIAGRFFDSRFVQYVEDHIIDELDERTSRDFPQTVDAWSELEATSDEDGLNIGGFQVMQEWEQPLMEVMVDAVAHPGVKILEVGYGMGISAAAIQEKGVSEHVILEPHPTVFVQLEAWAESRPSIRPVKTDWQEWHEEEPDGSFDSILFDTYPLRRSELHRNHFPFFPVAARLLRPGGQFTYYSDESSHICPEHQMMLLKYFDTFNVSLVEVTPPKDCEYWSSKSMVVIVATKTGS